MDMKKWIIYVLIMFTAIESFSQTKDSSLTVYATDRGNGWYQVSDVPDWMIDGVRAKIVSGDTLVAMKGYGHFTAEMLSIYANGLDMTSAINSAYDLP